MSSVHSSEISLHLSWNFCPQDVRQIARNREKDFVMIFTSNTRLFCYCLHLCVRWSSLHRFSTRISAFRRNRNGLATTCLVSDVCLIVAPCMDLTLTKRQQLALVLHSSQDPELGWLLLCLFFHVLPVSMWVSSIFFSSLPSPKNMLGCQLVIFYTTYILAGNREAVANPSYLWGQVRVHPGPIHPRDILDWWLLNKLSVGVNACLPGNSVIDMLSVFPGSTLNPSGYIGNKDQWINSYKCCKDTVLLQIQRSKCRPPDMMWQIGLRK